MWHHTLAYTILSLHKPHTTNTVLPLLLVNSILGAYKQKRDDERELEQEDMNLRHQERGTCWFKRAATPSAAILRMVPMVYKHLGQCQVSDKNSVDTGSIVSPMRPQRWCSMWRSAKSKCPMGVRLAADLDSSRCNQGSIQSIRSFWIKVSLTRSTLTSKTRSYVVWL
jgi:hypothetical protein